MTKDLRKAVEADEGASQLLHSLRDLIQSARQRALRAVDTIQVQTCWEIGRHIVEFEQGGSARAEYGARLLQTLASSLTSEFGKGFEVSNLWYMQLFYNAFPIRDALRHELSWTHYRTLLRAESEAARHWYMTEAADQGWTTRSLDRQISTLYYERLITTSDRTAVQDEARANLIPSQTPRDFTTAALTRALRTRSPNLSRILQSTCAKTSPSPSRLDRPSSAFSRNDAIIRHFYGAEMSGAMADPGQDPRGAPDLDPLWLMLDLTPEGRGTDWYPKLDYSQK
jgi:hypothetical protein